MSRLVDYEEFETMKEQTDELMQQEQDLVKECIAHKNEPHYDFPFDLLRDVRNDIMYNLQDMVEVDEDFWYMYHSLVEKWHYDEENGYTTYDDQSVFDDANIDADDDGSQSENDITSTPEIQQAEKKNKLLQRLFHIQDRQHDLKKKELLILEQLSQIAPEFKQQYL